MNVAFLFKKTPFVLLFLYFVISLNFSEAETSVRLRKVKNHVSPRHISLSERSGNGVYARRYAYGRPLPSYSTKGKVGRNRRYYSTRSSPGRRRNFSRNYASGYRNWAPNANLQGGRNSPRIDKIGQQKNRKGVYPFLKEPPLGGYKKNRRARPQRPLNPMQKPRPPKETNEFVDDYYFPEEAKRAETRYEFESRYPRPKKKRRPDSEDTFKKPDFSNIPYYDDKPFTFKSKPREPPYSYTSFVQHPSGLLDESEDLYEDPDIVFSKPVRSKKKRVKKKSNSRKKNKEQFKPFVFESDSSDDSYPPYISQDEYELPTKTYKKRNKPSYDPDDNENDFVPNQPSYTKPKPQVNNLFNTDSDYRGSQKTPQTSQFSPSFPQTWAQGGVIETTPHSPVQYQTENGFQPQTYIPNQYSYNNDYTVQNIKTVNPQQPIHNSQPQNNYKNVAFTSNNYNNYVNTKVAQTPTSYSSYSGNVYSSQPTYSQPVVSSSSTLTDVTIQKSVPVYDNTETFYNFNNNAYVNSQSSKYYNSDTQTKYLDANYGARLSGYKNKAGEKTDSESEFIKKHQNLYHNGLSGVPIQGDGYAKETVKKDYDIGYGDFQFDENPTS